MKPWYAIRDKAERAKAKAAFEATIRPIVQRGPRPDETQMTADALIVRGIPYAYADHGGPDLARMLAHAACPPLEPGHTIEVTKRSIIVDSVEFFRGVAATFTRITYEALQRAIESQSPASDGGLSPPT